MTLSTKQSIVMLSVNYAECNLCLVSFTSPFALSIVMLNVVVLNVVMLSVVMLSVIMLSVVALPSQGPKPQTNSSLYLRTILIFFNIVAHSRLKEHNYICNIYYEICPKYLPQNLTLQCLPIVVLVTTLH
jgi:hypothetical protein